VRELPQAIAVGRSADLKRPRPLAHQRHHKLAEAAAVHQRQPGDRQRHPDRRGDQPGNSGGPLLEFGRAARRREHGDLFAIGVECRDPLCHPVDVVNRVVPQLIRNGRGPAPGIGIVAGSETIATRLGVEGVIIVRTIPGSPAARAGLRGFNPSTGELGDVIVAANGQPVRGLADLAEQVERIGVGKAIELTLRHRGSKTSKKVEVTDVEIRATTSGVGIL
jgi:2-alkenal reductase